MKFKVQLICVADGQEEVREVACFDRHGVEIETLGLALADGKALLKAIQEAVVEEQLGAYIKAQQRCPDCGQVRPIKAYHQVTFRTVFGHLPVRSPRLHHCRCQLHPTKTFSPLAERLPEPISPELLYLETKWASLVSYGITVDLLKEVLPMDEKLNDVTLRNHVLKVAERMEQALGEERGSFIEGCPRDWGALPIPDGPLTVGIDGGFVRACYKQGHFEVIAGKSVLAFKREEPAEVPTAKCFAFVQTFDEKPRRRLFELLRSQGMQENQQVVFLSAGGEDVRSLPLYLNPESEHWLDWFHIVMRLTVLQQTAKGLPLEIGEGDETHALREEILKSLESIKWYLWHGNVYRALQHLEWVEMDLDAAGFERDDEVIAKRLKAVEEFDTYIRNNTPFIPNYGERFRHGETISTSTERRAGRVPSAAQGNGRRDKDRETGERQVRTLGKKESPYPVPEPENPSRVGKRGGAFRSTCGRRSPAPRR
jgi:hypothetical protein